MKASSDRRPSARRARGRPKDLDKRQAVLEAAKTLFGEHGYDAISMDAVARRAGVSKLTLYSHFGAKEDLFQAAVIAKCSEYTPDPLFDPAARGPLRARLRQIGTGFVALVNSPPAINLMRTLGEDARRNGKLGKLFFEVGPQRNLDRFSALLAAAHRAGELRVPDPVRAATHFFCLLQGIHHLSAVVGARPVARARVLRAHVDDVVELFLRAYAR